MKKKDSRNSTISKKNVLILDGDQRSALAATRSLGRKGIKVTAASEKIPCLSSCSKYCFDSFAYPSPYENTGLFLSIIKKESLRRKIDVILPMTEITTLIILKNKELFPSIVPFADFPAFDKLTDKWKLFKMAQSLGIPCPRTWFLSPEDDIEKLREELKFPLVLKPYKSRIFHNGVWRSTAVRYAYSWEDLLELRHQFPFRSHKLLLQEKIGGTGQGVFALYDRGNPIVFFAHRRIREKPPSGGVSVLRESVPVDPTLKETAKKILDEVEWHGVAMVEFKVTDEGMPFLMEVNARFWGSLQLAIDSGVDFPFLLYKLAIGEKVEDSISYKTNVKTRWLLGDLDHLYLSIFKRSSSCPPGYPGRLRCFIDFFNFFDRNFNFEVLKFADIRPFIFELQEYLK